MVKAGREGRSFRVTDILCHFNGRNLAPEQLFYCWSLMNKCIYAPHLTEVNVGMQPGNISAR